MEEEAASSRGDSALIHSRDSDVGAQARTKRTRADFESSIGGDKVTTKRIRDALDAVDETLVFRHNVEDQLSEYNEALDALDEEEMENALTELRSMARLLTAEDPTFKLRRRELQAVEEIHREKRSSDLIIHPVPFKAAVQDISDCNRTGFNFAPDALEALQEAAEAYLVGVFKECVGEAGQNGRDVIEPRDMKITFTIRQEDLLSKY